MVGNPELRNERHLGFCSIDRSDIMTSIFVVATACWWYLPGIEMGFPRPFGCAKCWYCVLKRGISFNVSSYCEIFLLALDQERIKNLNVSKKV